MGGESDATFLANLEFQAWDLDLAGCGQKGCTVSKYLRYEGLPADIKRVVKLAKEKSAAVDKLVERLAEQHRVDGLENRVWQERALDAEAGLPPDGEHLESEHRALHRRLKAENERLTAWLSLIDGGDTPCHNAHALQRHAFEALRGDAVPE